MVQHTSLQGFSHTSHYSTPLSVTTAAASLLCFLAIAIDTIRGFRQKKLWFPCKFFSLNAATVAVLGLATSPTLFLRSPMPSCGEQLEKLSSSILLCVSMGFFMPSLGAMSRADLIFNLVAVTVLAITMVVNICLQMGTEMVEFRFFVEHIIIIICIVALLLVLWFSLPETGIRDVCDIMYLCATNETTPSSFEETRDSLKETSKVAHVFNPQYILGRSSNCILTSVLCGISVAVLLQEILGSIMLGNSGYCNVVSDHQHGFSTWVVVAAQSIAIITAAVATTARWFVIAWHFGPERFVTWRNIFRVEQHHLMWWRELENQQMLPSGNGFHLKILRGLKRIIFYIVVIAQIDILITGKLMCYLSMWFTLMLKKLLDCLGYKLDENLNNENSRWVDSISSFLGERDLTSWMLSNWERDMTRWERRYGRNIPNHLIQLLSKWPPRMMHYFYHLSSPHLVLVMRIALLLCSNDEEQYKFLLDAFNQGLELILFVEENSNVQSIIFNRKISPILWSNRNDPDNWLNKKFERTGTGLGSVNVMELGILLQMFREYQERRRGDEFDILNHLSEGMEIMLLVDLVTIAIFTGGFEDDEPNAADFFEEIACQILRSLLMELPHSIYNEYSRYPFDQNCTEERIKRAMYFLSMSENLQDLVEFNWDDSDDEFISSISYSPTATPTNSPASSSSSEEWSFNSIS